MALSIQVGFDCADFSTAPSITIAGSYAGTKTISTGTFFHSYTAAGLAIDGRTSTSDGTADAATVLYLSFSSALQTQLQLIDASFTVSFSTSTGKYTIAATNAFTISCSTEMNFILGSPSTGSATSHVSASMPFYFIAPVVSGRSKSTDVREGDGIVHESVSDGGSDYGAARDVQEYWWDWQHTMEPKEAVLTRSVGGTPGGSFGTRTWSWQQFFRHARMQHPFAVNDTAASLISLHRFRAAGASMTTGNLERVAHDYDGLWAVNMRTRYLGYIT